MYAVRDDHDRAGDVGRPIARLHPDHPARHATRPEPAWSDDLDRSLDPLPAPRPRRSNPALVLLFAVAMLTLLGLGALGAFVLSAGVVALLMLVLLPAPAHQAPAPIRVAPAPTEIAAPAPPPVAPPTPAVPRRAAPVAEPGVDANLVVMPDPGFRAVPVDQAIRKLHQRAGDGEIGAVGGH